MRVDPRLRMADDVAALIRDAVRSMAGLPGPFMTSIFAEPLAVEIRDGDLWVRPATGDEVAELLTCLLADKAQSDPGVFRSRAMALVGAIAPVLVWLRDHKGVPLNINTMQVSTAGHFLEQPPGDHDMLAEEPRQVVSPRSRD